MKTLEIKIAVFLVLIVLAGTAWLFRWQVVEHPGGNAGPTAFLINRITGEVSLVAGRNWSVLTKVTE